MLFTILARSMQQHRLPLFSGDNPAERTLLAFGAGKTLIGKMGSIELFAGLTDYFLFRFVVTFEKNVVDCNDSAVWLEDTGGKGEAVEYPESPAVFLLSRVCHLIRPGCNASAQRLPRPSTGTDRGSEAPFLRHHFYGTTKTFSSAFCAWLPTF